MNGLCAFQSMVRDRPQFGWVAIAIIAVLALALRHNIGMMAATYAGHDDQMLFKLGTEVGTGNWLGAYDRLTLAKGPMLSFVVAAAWHLGLSFKTLEFIIFLSAAAVIAYGVFRVLGSWGLAVSLFATLAFDPGQWNQLRLMRAPLYSAFSLAVIGFLVLLVLDRNQRSMVRQCVLAGGLGLSFAAYWLTREESVWLYPTIALIVAYGAFSAIWKQRGQLRQSMRRTLIASSFAVLGFALGVGPVIILNWVHYGVPITNELRPGPFLRAYAALARIDSPSPSRYVPVSQAARELAYSVSPASQELKPYLEGDIGYRWLRPWAKNCKPGPKCVKDLEGGWFIWALRESAAAAGHFKTATHAASYFGRMATEIDAACDAGRIPCLPKRDSFAPRLQRSDLGPMATAMREALWRIVSLQPGRIGPQASRGDPALLAQWRKVLGPLSPPKSHAKRAGLRIHFARIYSGAASIVFPALWIFAALGFLAHVAFNPRDDASHAIAVFLMACLAAVGVRAFIAAYLQATTTVSGGIQIRYLVPAYGFAIIFAIVGTYLLIRSVGAWYPQLWEPRDDRRRTTVREPGRDARVQRLPA